jgi:hypothetical protein
MKRISYAVIIAGVVGILFLVSSTALGFKLPWQKEAQKVDVKHTLVISDTAKMVAPVASSILEKALDLNIQCLDAIVVYREARDALGGKRNICDLVEEKRFESDAEYYVAARLQDLAYDNRIYPSSNLADQIEPPLLQAMIDQYTNANVSGPDIRCKNVCKIECVAKTYGHFFQFFQEAISAAYTASENARNAAYNADQQCRSGDSIATLHTALLAARDAVCSKCSSDELPNDISCGEDLIQQGEELSPR